MLCHYKVPFSLLVLKSWSISSSCAHQNTGICLLRRLLFPEKIVERDKRLDIVGICVMLDPKGRHHREVDGSSRLDGSLQFRLLVGKGLVILRRHDIRPRPVFHFADIDDAVSPVDEKVYLRIRIPPRMDIGKHPAYAKRLLDAVDVLKAKTGGGFADVRSGEQRCVEPLSQGP